MRKDPPKKTATAAGARGRPGLKVISPLRAAGEVLPLIAAGADAFYAGVAASVVFSRRDAEQGPSVSCRPYDSGNFPSAAEFRKAAALAGSRGRPVFFTANTRFYSDSQRKALVKFIRSVPGLGGVIVADPVLIGELSARLPGLELVASCEARVLNSGTTRFLEELGAGTAILSRHLTLKEMEAIVRANPRLRYECFAGRSCRFLQSMCYYTHDPDDPEATFPCNKLTAFRDLPPGEPGAAGRPRGTCLPPAHTLCGACAFGKLARMGISAVKVVGREDTLDNKVRNVRFFKLAAANAGLPDRAFTRLVRRAHRIVYGEDCRERCLY